MNNARRIRNLGKATKIISRIISVILFIGFFFTILASVALYVIPNDLFSYNVDFDVDVVFGEKLRSAWSDAEDKGIVVSDNITINPNDEGVEVKGTLNGNDFNLDLIAVVCMMSSISILLLGLAFHFVARYGKEVELTQEPFSSDCMNKLRSTGIAFLVWSIGGIAVEFITNIIVSVSTHNGIFKTSMSVNLGAVLITVLFYIFICIMRAAAENRRQQEQYDYYAN